jgi:sugar/nucleoside kinase (ribokinase family)
VRCNAQEARSLTGEAELEFAAAALLDAGARAVVISDGPGGALLRGARVDDLDVPGVRAQVRSTIGAGDCLTAALIAGLQAGGYRTAALEPALRAGVELAARACERWGACD